nr:PH domain-containing protein [Schumannella sp. 10F1B-5-1]
MEPVPGEWRRVSPKYLRYDLISMAIFSVVFIFAMALPWLLSGMDIWFLLLLPIGTFVVMALVLIFTPRRVRAIGYQLREDDLVLRRGILFQRFVAVPYGRMQLVDVTRGPIERSLGLSQLKLVTAAAASNVQIPGLTEADADALRDHLVELAETRRAGL